MDNNEYFEPIDRSEDLEDYIKVLVCEVDKEPYLKTIKNDYREFQKIVDGNFEGSFFKEGIIMYTHELGKFEKEPNRAVGKDYIFGDFCFVGVIASEEVSLTDSQIKEIKDHLSNNKWCPICGNDIIGRPALSRQIKGLRICSDCGRYEALAEMGVCYMPTNKIINMIKEYRK